MSKSDTSKHGKDRHGINTRLAHCGNDPHEFFGFVNPPIARGSTVLFPNSETLFGRGQRYVYGTHGTPTTDALCMALNELEGARGTILVPSGLAAVTVPLLAFLSAGDHCLIVDSVYGPTRLFANDVLTRMGVEVQYYEPLIGADICKSFKPNTKVVFMEAPGSNTFEMQDVPAIAAQAAKIGAVSMIDNTWATPLYFKPLNHGVDLSIHALTKYPAGHADILMGSVSANEKTWQRLDDTRSALGICVNSDDAYGVLRGLRSMGVRLEHHARTTAMVIDWLKSRTEVGQILYPALADCPGHEFWKRDFCGASGLLSFVLKGADKKAAGKFLDALTIFGMGYSWGGYESLAIAVNLGDRTIAKGPPADGPNGGALIRLQIGLEDCHDLTDDLARGFAALA